MKNRVLIMSCDADFTKRWKRELAGKVDVYIARSCNLADQAVGKHSFDALVVDDSIVKARSDSEEPALLKRIRFVAEFIKGPKIAAANHWNFVRPLRKAGMTSNATRVCVPDEILRALKLE